MRILTLKLIICAFLAGMAANLAVAQEPQAASSASTPFFRITVIDDQTSRGIPLVRLTLVNSGEYYTDSAGVVAFWEPDLIGKDVSVTVESFGYSAKKNWFGQPTFGFKPTPSGSVVIPMQRRNIAQRIYRVTGTGIFRDSLMLGDQAPIMQDYSDLPVMGMDSVENAVYHGKLFWIWGDTGISSTNLGNFKATGAVSDLLGKGGLDPDDGVYLNFFRQDDGRVQKMVKTDHKGPVWLGALRVGRDKSGKEHLFAHYSKIVGSLSSSESGIVEFNDESRQFEQVLAYPPDMRVQPGGNPFRYEDHGTDYYYYIHAVPCVRSRTDAKSIVDLASYEAFTCLKPGSKFDGTAAQLDRDRDGRLRWGWKKNTSLVNEGQIGQLIKAGHMKPEEALYKLTDVNTGKPFWSHGASVYWNPYRNRWVSVQSQNFGSSWLGEVWYFEADTPLGPWVYGQKIITHAEVKEVKKGGQRVDEEGGPNAETYGFYGPKQHPEFDKDGGRVIFLEGTYTMSFSTAKHATPRYNYNQIMYKLELDNPRLFLPVPVYRVDAKIPVYRTKMDIESDKADREVAFFAPDRPREGTVPVYETIDKDNKTGLLSTTKPEGEDSAKIAFYAAEVGSEAATATEATTETKALADASSTGTLSVMKPLYEFKNESSGERIYSTKESVEEPGFVKADAPVCRVWDNPLTFNPYRVGK